MTPEEARATDRERLAEAIARDLLASDWLAEHDRRVRAEALRGAADDIDFYLADKGVCMSCEGNALSEAERWLTARADRIERGKA